MNNDWEELFAMARFVVCSYFRYFTRLCYAINIVPPTKTKAQDILPYGEACLAVVTPRWQLLLNPELLDTITDRYKLDSTFLAVTIWLHELLHILRKHLQRGEGKISFLWNIAADCEENDDLVEILLQTFKQGLVQQILESDILVIPDKFNLPKGLSAEEYYSLLLSKDDWVSSQLRSKYKEMVESMEGGSGDKHFAMDYLVSGEQQQGVEKEIDGMDAITQEYIIRTTAQEILSYSKDIGKVPHSLVRWAEGILTPKVDWREILRRKVKRMGELMCSKMGDYTYLRPHKLSMWHVNPPIIFPTQVSPRTPIVTIIDTSGSMSERELAQAIAEVKGIVRSGGHTTYILSCDAEVHTVTKVWGDTLPHEKIKLVGGGGTNMVEGLRWAQKNVTPPPIAIILTDGYSSWDGADEIKIPVICCLIGKNRAAKETIPAHFDVVEVEITTQEGD